MMKLIIVVEYLICATLVVNESWKGGRDVVLLNEAATARGIGLAWMVEPCRPTTSRSTSTSILLQLRALDRVI
jgi:hypothetical protein